MARIFWDTNSSSTCLSTARLVYARDRVPAANGARGDKLLTSYLTLGEALAKPKETGNSMLEKSYLNFFINGPIELIAFEARGGETVCRDPLSGADSARGRYSTRLRGGRRHRSFCHER